MNTATNFPKAKSPLAMAAAESVISKMAAGEKKSVSVAQWLRGSDGDGGGASLQNAYQQSVWIYACITAIGEQVAQTAFRFSKGQRRGQSLVESGPIVDLFQQPNKQQNRFGFWELIVAWL